MKSRLLILLITVFLTIYSYGQKNESSEKEIGWVVQTNLIRPIFYDAELGLLRRDNDKGDFLIYGRYLVLDPWGDISSGPICYYGDWGTDLEGFALGAQYRIKPKSKSSVNTKYAKSTRGIFKTYFWGPYLEYAEYNGSGDYSFRNIVSTIAIPDYDSKSSVFFLGALIGAPIIDGPLVYSDFYLGVGASMINYSVFHPEFDYNIDDRLTYYEGNNYSTERSFFEPHIKIGLNIGLKL